MEIAPSMARLHEYQGKAILAANGFKIPRGRAASNADEAIAIAKELAAGKKSAEVVIKIQAWTTGRAGIGGVAFAKRPTDVRGHAARMLGMKVGLLANATPPIPARPVDLPTFAGMRHECWG